MIRLALQTGLRVSELAGLNHEHVAVATLPREYLDLPAALAKYRRSRVIQLSPGARRAVADLVAFNVARGFSIDPKAPLFQNRCHQRVTVRALQRLVKAYREKAELDIRVTPYVLRHTMATNFQRHSGDVETLHEVLGHRRLETTKVYIHLSKEIPSRLPNFPEPLIQSPPPGSLSGLARCAPTL